MAKGASRTIFDIPDNYFSDHYKGLGTALASRFEADTDNKIPVANITLPDISIPLQLGRRENFSLFIPKHRIIAAKLIDIFMNMRNFDDLMSAAVYCRDRVNPYLFNYALSVVMLHRPDTKHLPLPNFVEAFPGKFMDSGVFSRAREEATAVPDGSRNPVVIPRDFTASDLDPEHRVAYFREDIGINLHHWHWHLVYPFNATDRALVNKDRRGELFYYMHQQIVARYNFERLSNNLMRVTRFNNHRAPIAEGYFSKLEQLVASRAWPPRFANTTLSDVNRSTDNLRQDVAELDIWRDRFRGAIEQGYIVNTAGTQVPLTEQTGIDILGNIMESSILTPNRDFYGDMHNMGHVLIALCHDPDGRYLETFSIMGDSATAMRDPIFYRWHAFIDDLFQLHKGRLPRYTVDRLNFPNVTVTGLQIEVPGGQPNRLQTFWEQSDMNLERGLDFSPRGSVFARFTHLQHIPFNYRIQVTNTSTSQQLGTVRIFMAPRFDERGVPFQFNEQRLMMIELDRFRVNLRAGRNLIIRGSDESSVTIPYERTFRSLQTNRPADGTTALEGFNFCGCGWPQHMLIPKGTLQGMTADVFVMVSNYANDRVDQDVTGLCNDADSFCGIRDRLYPDRQSMGFPFDRMARNGVATLEEFLTPNMRSQEVTITYTDRTVLRSQDPVANSTTPTAK